MAATVEVSRDIPFLRQLAISDSQTRASALDQLRLYLRSHNAFISVELLKLWKGLFYSMWMADRPRTQQRLAVDLAELVDVLREENVLLFLEAFWATIAREWGGIDALRMDKYLYLIRRYLYTTFCQCLRHISTIPSHLDILQATPLNPTNPKIPNGLRYHLLDIYVDELERAAEEVKETPVEVLRQMLSPVEEVAGKSPTKSVRKRAKETLEDSRIAAWDTNDPAQTTRATSASMDGKMDGHTDTTGDAVELNEDEEEWSGIEDD